MTTLRAILATAMCGAQLSILAGCAAPGENLSDKGGVAVQRVSSAKVDILWADVYRTDESLVVRGAVRHHHYSSRPVKVHVDAVVLGGDGAVLEETIGPDIWVPRRLLGKGLNYKSFELCLPVAVPEGGTIRLVCHTGPHDIGSGMDIIQNQNRGLSIVPSLLCTVSARQGRFSGDVGGIMGRSYPVLRRQFTASGHSIDKGSPNEVK